MTFEWMKIPYSLLTLFIVLNYGLLMTAIIAKIGARAGRRIGIPFYQNYIDLLKNYALRSKITHGYMFYLGPVFRLTGGIGLLLFVPTIYGSEMFSNLSFSGDLILALYFIFFGTLGMALGAGESGSPHAAIGISRGLSQVTMAELPLTLAVFATALAVVAAMLAFLGSMMRPPFDVVIAPQEIPIGPPTEYHSAYLALMQTNRVIFPVAKIVIYMNLFFGGASSWGEFAIKVFLLYLFSAFVGVAFPRFRVEQSIRFFMIWAVPIGILSILLV
ncbi:respiratory chain complex I subunit 1 family protein [Profundibacter sp.]|uniref:respiratory chain complex I subunit 1 family protein n=1 Tax=Profundibacter sp. TaxID=3101071 RepID=UPI003D0DD743